MLTARERGAGEVQAIFSPESELLFKDKVPMGGQQLQIRAVVSS